MKLKDVLNEVHEKLSRDVNKRFGGIPGTDITWVETDELREDGRTVTTKQFNKPPVSIKPFQKVVKWIEDPLCPPDKAYLFDPKMFSRKPFVLEKVKDDMKPIKAIIGLAALVGGLIVLWVKKRLDVPTIKNVGESLYPNLNAAVLTNKHVPVTSPPVEPFYKFGVCIHCKHNVAWHGETNNSRLEGKCRYPHCGCEGMVL